MYNATHGTFQVQSFRDNYSQCLMCTISTIAISITPENYMSHSSYATPFALFDFMLCGRGVVFSPTVSLSR